VVDCTWACVRRYGKHYTLSLRSDIMSWSVLLFTVVLQMIGQCFNSSVYPVTSNAGNICLLIGVTWMVHKVQKDLILAGAFADFLHTSNMVYKMTMDRARMANNPNAANSSTMNVAAGGDGQYSHYAMSMARTASTRFAQIFSPNPDGTALPMETEMGQLSHTNSQNSFRGQRTGSASMSNYNLTNSINPNHSVHSANLSKENTSASSSSAAAAASSTMVKRDRFNDELVTITPRYELAFDLESNQQPVNGHANGQSNNSNNMSRTSSNGNISRSNSNNNLANIVVSTVPASAAAAAALGNESPLPPSQRQQQATSSFEEI
jgi:hypothetical protein